MSKPGGEDGQQKRWEIEYACERGKVDTMKSMIEEDPTVVSTILRVGEKERERERKEKKEKKKKKKKKEKKRKKRKKRKKKKKKEKKEEKRERQEEKKKERRNIRRRKREKPRKNTHRFFFIGRENSPLCRCFLL